MADDTAAAPEQHDATQGAELTRGQFLTKMSIGLGGLMGALIAVPVAGMALAPAVKPKTFKATKLGDIADFEAEKDSFKMVVLDPNKGEFDGYVRKRVAYVRMNDKTRDKVAASVMHKGKSQADFSVISNRCAHLGCPVSEGGGQFVCPCHGGAYDSEGIRTAGPPARSLDRFMWEVRGKELWAVDEYSVTRDGKKADLHGPGQHAGDVEGLLYPLQP